MFTKSQINSVKDSDLIFVVNPKLKEYPKLQPHNGTIQQDQKSQQSHASILRVFFLFAYCLCISPFRVVREADGGNVAKRWIVQSVACGLVSITALFTRFTDVRKAFPSVGEQWNPVVYFRIFHTICSLGLTLNAWWSLWWKSDRFVDVLEYIDSTKTLPNLTPLKISYSTIAAVVCFVYACLGFVSALLGSELMDSNYWTPWYWSRCLTLEARYQFFTGNETNCNTTDIEALKDISSADHFIASFTGFGQLFKYITSFYWELLILFGVISLWLPAAAFANFVKDDRDDDDDDDDDDSHYEERILEAAAQWPQIEEQYLALKGMCGTLY